MNMQGIVFLDDNSKILWMNETVNKSDQLSYLRNKADNRHDPSQFWGETEEPVLGAQFGHTEMPKKYSLDGFHIQLANVVNDESAIDTMIHDMKDAGFDIKDHYIVKSRSANAKFVTVRFKFHGDQIPMEEKEFLDFFQQHLITCNYLEENSFLDHYSGNSIPILDYNYSGNTVSDVKKKIEIQVEFVDEGEHAASRPVVSIPASDTFDEDDVKAMIAVLYDDNPEVKEIVFNVKERKIVATLFYPKDKMKMITAGNIIETIKWDNVERKVSLEASDFAPTTNFQSTNHRVVGWAFDHDLINIINEALIKDIFREQYLATLEEATIYINKEKFWFGVTFPNTDDGFEDFKLACSTEFPEFMIKGKSIPLKLLGARTSVLPGYSDAHKYEMSDTYLSLEDAAAMYETIQQGKKSGNNGGVLGYAGAMAGYAAKSGASASASGPRQNLNSVWGNNGGGSGIFERKELSDLKSKLTAIDSKLDGYKNEKNEETTYIKEGVSELRKEWNACGTRLLGNFIDCLVTFGVPAFMQHVFLKNGRWKRRRPQRRCWPTREFLEKIPKLSAAWERLTMISKVSLRSMSPHRQRTTSRSPTSTPGRTSRAARRKDKRRTAARASAPALDLRRRSEVNRHCV